MILKLLTKSRYVVQACAMQQTKPIRQLTFFDWHLLQHNWRNEHYYSNFFVYIVHCMERKYKYLLPLQYPLVVRSSLWETTSKPHATIGNYSTNNDVAFHVSGRRIINTLAYKWCQPNGTLFRRFSCSCNWFQCKFGIRFVAIDFNDLLFAFLIVLYIVQWFIPYSPFDAPSNHLHLEKFVDNLAKQEV